MELLFLFKASPPPTTCKTFFLKRVIVVEHGLSVMFIQMEIWREELRKILFEGKLMMGVSFASMVFQ